jgi:hypothetical protein
VGLALFKLLQRGRASRRPRSALSYE